MDATVRESFPTDVLPDPTPIPDPAEHGTRETGTGLSSSSTWHTGPGTNMSFKRRRLPSIAVKQSSGEQPVQTGLRSERRAETAVADSVVVFRFGNELITFPVGFFIVAVDAVFDLSMG